MSCDKLVFDLSQEVEGSPNVFIRKDWINILDNQNQNYQNNQCIIDTSQLANSNKYMGYREGYLAVPMLLSMNILASGAPGANGIVPNDYSLGLKNWFGSIIHSFTLDYNGTTIIQQTPFCNMWNIFKLLTTLSYNDLITMGSTIGFYPDKSGSCSYFTAVSGNGSGVCNNDFGTTNVITSSLVLNNYDLNQSTGGAIVTTGGNIGATYRTKWIAYDGAAGITSSAGVASVSYSTFGTLANSITNIWKNNIVVKTNIPNPAAGLSGVTQIAVMGTIYLKHLHSFFNMCPLLKGVFMKMTMNLNNATSEIGVTGLNGANKIITLNSSSVPVGGVQPILIPSSRTGLALANTSDNINATITYELVVGAQSYNSTIKNGYGYVGGNLAKSVYLYVPAYTFNPTFEQAYLANSVKQVKYTDIYQYQVLNVPSNNPFNNLITNGIANIKSVLIIPFFAVNGGALLTTGTIPEFQSPFDTAGCGTTAPMVSLGNFNVQISGQNAIYNMQRYSFEEWNNQLYGQNAVNGGLTDGLTSGLIDFMDFQNAYCYYYVNVERMLPVEQSVPKSVQILGTNYSTQALNLWVFVEYGVSVAIDVLTGARV